jgi:hypothetical protein
MDGYEYWLGGDSYEPVPSEEPPPELVKEPPVQVPPPEPEQPVAQ